MQTALYIHIPFCKQKCKYCDFASFAGREFLIDTYLDALGKEAVNTPVKNFQTVYVGGGTPSLLSVAQLEKLCQVIEKHFGPIPNFSESTVEANPESISREKLELLKRYGFNRLSIGLQSFNNRDLQTIGRIHTAEQFLQAYENAQKCGFNNINVDLIAGLPHQTFSSFSESLTRVVALKPSHISVYGLQIEEGTPFFEQGIICDQILMRKMLEKTHFLLMENGYHHYEISNFALHGKEAKHNTHYWNNGDYVGLGSAAASYINGVRSQNTPDVAEYIRRIQEEKSSVVFSERLEGKARVGESLMLAFRKLDGVELTAEQQKFFGAEIKKHLKNGLLIRDGKKVKLSLEGLFLANEVFCSFVEPFEEL